LQLPQADLRTLAERHATGEVGVSGPPVERDGQTIIRSRWFVKGTYEKGSEWSVQQPRITAREYVTSEPTAGSLDWVEVVSYLEAGKWVASVVFGSRDAVSWSV
jgi:hypothetical protein